MVGFAIVMTYASTLYKKSEALQNLGPHLGFNLFWLKDVFSCQIVKKMTISILLLKIKNKQTECSKHAKILGNFLCVCMNKLEIF